MRSWIQDSRSKVPGRTCPGTLNLESWIQGRIQVECVLNHLNAFHLVSSCSGAKLACLCTLNQVKSSIFRARLLIYVLLSLRHSPDPNNPRVSAEAEILEKGVGTWGGTIYIYIYIYIYKKSIY